MIVDNSLHIPTCVRTCRYILAQYLQRLMRTSHIYKHEHQISMIMIQSHDTCRLFEWYSPL